MQRTKSKLLSILLSLVMLLSLLPTTALAATYPDSVRVYNANGDIKSLSDKQYLAANDATNASDGYDGTQTYVARYEKSTGTLYLKDYHGVATDGRILADGDLNIEVEGDSSFTTSLSSATNHLYGIQANGTLTISGSGTLTVSATGKGNVYGIYAKEGVTISAPLAVTVKKNNTEETGPVYGIYTESGAISLSGADKTITATGGKDPAYGVYNEAQTSSSAASNITISGKLTVNLSDGSYNRGISSQGGDITLNGATVKILGSYHYGIFNLNGNVVIKSTPDVELTPTTSSGEGICTYDGGNLTIENSTVKVSAEGYAANLKGNVSIKDSMVDLTRTSSYYEVIKTGNSSAANTIDLSGTGTVTLTASGEQTNNAMITGKVTLVGSTKCETGTINGSSYDGVYDGSSKTVLQFVHESAASTTLKGIDIITNPPLTLAVPTAAPNATATNERSLAVTGVYDDGTGGPVAVNWKITTDPIPTGVSLDGSTLKVTNEAEAGQVRVLATSDEGYTDAEFVTITKDTAVESAIVLTAPASTTVAVPKSDTPNEIALPTAAVYDQYGKLMTGTFSITYESVGTTPTGVTLAAGAGKIKVDRTAQAGEVKVIAKLGTTLTSDPVTYTITRETSKVTSVRVNAPEYLMDVPKVTEPGTPNQAYQQFNAAKVLDQYGQEMTGQTVTWSVADDAGNPVTGVSIDDTGKLTVTNEAPAITVYVTATCLGIESNKSKVTLSKEPTKATLVEIFNQAEEDPETSLLIPAATFTNSEAYTAKVYDQYGKETGEMVFWNLDKTYTGVELDTTTSTGNAILKVENTATPGTIKLIATCSTSGSTARKTLDIALVDKTPASVTAVPAAKTGLFYNGTDQALVTAGTASGGTMQYSLDGTTWSTAVPTGKNVGAYTVQYKVVGDATHTDTAPEKCQLVTISPKFLTMDNLTPTGSTSKVYDGTTNSSITVGVKAGVLFGSDTLTITGTAVYNSANVNEANTITFTPDAITGNYELVPGVLTITGAKITPRDLTVTPNAGQSKKFGAEDPTLHSTNSGRVPCQIPDFSGALSRAEGEDVGQYDITLGTLALIDHFSSGFKASNYTLKMVSPAVKFEITKADAPAAPTGLKGYKDNALSTVTLPTGWSWVDGTLKMNTIGDQTFKANYAGDTNHQAGTNVDVTVKVVRRSSGGGGSYYAPVVPDMPMVYWGCTGDAVKTLQEKLNAKGFHSGNVDGIFGAKTYAAVTAFQKANSLGVDGIVGKLTWAKLYDATPVNVTPATTQPMLRTGSRGDAVRKLQELLNAKGYTCGSVDGIFGSKTYAAVLAFQKANGLAADGIVGSLTWAKLG